MTSYKKDCNSAKYLIPLYVKGMLTDAEKEDFERILSECPELKDEIEEWRKIDNTYKTIEMRLPQVPHDIYPKITAKIRERRKIGFFERLMPSRRFSLAIAAIQLLIIIVLGVYVLHLKTEYKTLSTTSITPETSMKINVVFKEDVSEAEMRELLLKIDAKIIDGPYSSGLYIIRISSKEGLDDALTTLSKSSFVVMAEKAY